MKEKGLPFSGPVLIHLWGVVSSSAEPYNSYNALCLSETAC